MTITILSEAKSLEGFGFEHGLSFLVEVDGQKILLDTGASDLYCRNAERLDIDLDEIDRVVLSHGHFDHGDGLAFIEGKPLVCHPGCFRKRFRESESVNIGLALTRSELAQRMDLETSADPMQLTQHLWFLGEVPRRNDFEATETRYVLEDGEKDFITDDSGLACITSNGLVVISGCAHSGICNMVDHARKVSGTEHVDAVIGGFHLSRPDRQTKRTIEYLKMLDVMKVMPSHCTREPALSLFRKAFGDRPVYAGDKIFFL